MAPTRKHGKTRQKEYFERNMEKIRSKDRLRKRESRKNTQEKDPQAWQEYLKADAMRKRLSRAKKRVEAAEIENSNNSSACTSSGPEEQAGRPDPPSPNIFKHRATLSRSIKRAASALPRSPRKKTAVLKKLFRNLTADKKTKIGEDSMAARRARKLTEKAKRIAAEFLERSDISYTCPGQRDQVYCGKDETGERVYRPKRYLLWKYSEVLAMLNDELEIKLGEKDRIGYGTFQYYMKMQKHIKPFSEVPHFSCLCPKCENLDLLITALQKHFPDIPTTSKSELLKLIVCDPKSPGCIDGSCDECPGIAAISGLEFCEDEDVLYHQWKKQEGKNYREKVMESGTTEETKELFLAQLLEYKRHHYNKLRQHEEMAYLRKHLEAGEAIIQVDFSENYENRQQKEIQSVYFGHEAYAIYTACLWYILAECKKVTSASFAFVTDSTDHSKFGAFHYNKLLIRKASELVSGSLKAVHFFSDGCAAQFKSRYCFALLTGYCHDVELTWSFFESHHGKGVVDGIGGTVKSSVHKAVRANKVVIHSTQHFAEYADQTLNIGVTIPSTSIQQFEIPCAVLIPGTQAIRFVQRSLDSDEIRLNFYRNTVPTGRRSSSCIRCIQRGSITSISKLLS